MAEKKNLCAMIPIALHQRVSECKDAEGMTTSEYIEKLLTEYYEMKENGGNSTMANGSRTMAFQISEELFQRIKAHLDRESARTGKRLTQREFVLGLIETALEEAIRSAGLEELFRKEPVYCPVCGDKGGADCGCYTEILAEKILASSGLPEGSEALSELRTEVYPAEADKALYGAAESPRKQAESCIRRTGEFISGEGGEKDKKLLLISGQVGVGKTWLAAAAGREAAKGCAFVCYRKIAALFDDMIAAGSYSEDADDRAQAQERREYAEEAGLLIIADLGIEVVSGKKIEYLITLIDLRAGAGLRTIVTSNLTLSDIAREYGERLASRFADRDNSTCLRLIGPDLRLRRKI